MSAWARRRTRRGASEEAVVADAVEAARQHVQEKAADELGRVEGHGLEPVAAFDPVVLPFEGDARLVEGDETGVRGSRTRPIHPAPFRAPLILHVIIRNALGLGFGLSISWVEIVSTG